MRAGYGGRGGDKRTDPVADALFVEAVQLFGKDMKVGLSWGACIGGRAYDGVHLAVVLRHAGGGCRPCAQVNVY
jgi:hypothetical protein